MFHFFDNKVRFQASNFKAKLLFLAFIFFSNLATANYITSAELTYTCVRDYVYSVKLVVYAECGQFDLSTQGSYDLKVSSASANKELTLRLFKNLSKPLDGEEITLYCPSQQALTRCKPGGTLRGIRKYEFIGELNLSAEPRAADWLVSWQRDFRSINLNTSLNPQNFSYYVESLINTRDISCNSSPQFNGSSIAVGYLNQNNTFNILASDPNGDSLVYSIVQPKTSPTTTLTYRSGFSALRPVDLQSNLTINNRTGAVTYRPLTDGQSGISDIRIDEYRNGVLIGSSNVGMQINGFANDNRPPVLSGFGGSGNVFTKTICEGEVINVDDLRIVASDPDDNFLSVTQVSGNGQGFNGVSGTGALTAFISPPITQGTYTYVVNAVDNGCQLPQTTTRTYTLNITPKPKFELEPSGPVVCDPPTPIEVKNLSGNGSFSYAWSVNGQIRSTLDTFAVAPQNSDVKVSLEITDVNGCKSTSMTELKFPIAVFFSTRKFCIKDTTELTNTSINLLQNSFVTSWRFPDGTVLNGNSVKYKFQDTLTYNVIVSMEDTLSNCNFTGIAEVKICPQKELIIQASDTCTNRLELTDVQNYGHPNCQPIFYEWRLSDRTNVIVGGPTLILGELEEGVLNVTVTAFTSSSCTYTENLTYNIKKQHDTRISDRFNTDVNEGFSLICNKPDSTFYTRIVTNPNGGIVSNWFVNGFPVNGNLDSLQVTGSLTAGLITIDNVGCKDTSSVTISFPLQANFNFDQKCYPDTTYQFVNLTNYAENPNDLTFEWRLQGVDTVKSVNAQFALPERDNYLITLVASDKNNCISEVTKPVFNKAFVDVFNVFPDERTTSICATDIITGYSLIPTSIGSNVNSITWNYGDGRTQTFLTKETYTDVNDNPMIEGDTVTFTYNSDAIVEVSFEARFNNVCLYQSNKKTINVKPEFKGNTYPYRNCIGDTSVFLFDRTTGDLSVGVKSYYWAVSKQGDIDVTVNGSMFNPFFTNPPFFISDKAEPKYKFNELLDLHVYHRLIDSNGCVFANINSAKVGEMTVPFLPRLDTICQNEFANIAVGTRNRTATGAIAVADSFGVDLFGRTLFSGLAIRDQVTDLVGNATVKFPVGGDVPITIFMKKTNIFIVNNKVYDQECRGVLDTILHVRPIPNIIIQADTACAGVGQTNFKSQVSFSGVITQPKDTIIKGYLWDFGDGTTSTLKNPSHQYQTGGRKPISLTVKTDYCDFVILDTILVRGSPKADMFFDSAIVEALTPYNYQNLSTSDSPIVSAVWDFGDGTVLETLDPIVEHTYSDVDVYTIRLTVTNKEGCSSFIEKIADMNSRLDLPNAFSPNGDGKNDGLRLIYKLIPQLQEFKIYNRWGQVVFDAGNNLDAVWDGKLNGTDQELGVYVAYVKAIGKYDKTYNFKRNILLVR
ncbi:MAG: PKD domain-containing protein [Cytophagales bacterium]